MRALVCCLALLAGLGLAACSGEREPELGALPPAAFRPQDFRDLPIPPGFAPEGSDLLAVSYGDGALRRYRATFQQPKGAKAMSRDEVLTWYQGQLPGLGWQLSKQTEKLEQIWLKEHEAGHTERLLLETGRANRRTIIRLSLAPQRL